MTVDPSINPRIETGWKEALMSEFSDPYFASLKAFLVLEKQKHTVYPPGSLLFNAFNQTPFDKVKGVILGQDPYHGPGQAHGLCFSVPEGIETPPSLRNIFKELSADLQLAIPAQGNLSKWAGQGVLLLNATLTVRAHQAGSHQGKGWERFTDQAISRLSSEKEHLVFLLWGKYAQAKESLIDTEKHLVLKAAHPSPLSAHNGFFGCKHFSRANQFLQEQGIPPIDWEL